jgi:hypothetical protein
VPINDQGAPQTMHFRNLVSLSVPFGLIAATALAQTCRPGTAEYDVSIQCSCIKDPNGQPCDLYKRNKSMYDGKGIQMWQPTEGAQKTDPTPYRPSQPRATQPSAANRLRNARRRVRAGDGRRPSGRDAGLVINGLVMPSFFTYRLR